MAQLTTIPTRQKAELAHILIQERNSGEESPSIAELMFHLRQKFAKEHEEISSKILYCGDSMFYDSLGDSSNSSGLNDALYETKESAQPHARIQPPTPVRPDSSALAKLLEVSSTEWSDLSDPDTTADSKLAGWLASFANSRTTEVPSMEHMPVSRLQPSSDRSTSSGFYESPNSSFALHLSEVAPPGHTPWKPRTVTYFKRPRAFSDPGTPCPKPSFLTIRDPDDSFVDNSMSRLSGDTHLSYHSAPSSQLRFFPPFDFEVHPQPSVMTQLNPELLYPSIPDTPVTPELETPTTLDGFDSPLQPISRKAGYQDDSIRGRAVRFQDVNESITIHSRAEASFAGASSLYDISDTYAFNRALKHAAKSPHLIRNWKRVLEELAGRFALELGTVPDGPSIRFSLDASRNDQYSGGGGGDSHFVSSSTPTRPPNPTKDNGVGSRLIDPSTPSAILGDSSMGIQFDSIGSTKGKKTAADTLLNQEYSAHLRKSIERKEAEMKALAQLIVQRDATIAQLRGAFRRTELGGSPSE